MIGGNIHAAKKEEAFIDSTLVQISARFPESNYKYELIDDTHYIVVYGITKGEKESFLDFTLDILSDFIKEGFSSMIHLTDKELIVDMLEPNRFSLKGEIIPRKKVMEDAEEAYKSWMEMTESKPK